MYKNNDYLRKKKSYHRLMKRTYQTHENIAVRVMVFQCFHTDLISFEIIVISSYKPEGGAQGVYFSPSVSYENLGIFINPYISTTRISLKRIYKVGIRKCEEGFCALLHNDFNYMYLRGHCLPFCSNFEKMLNLSKLILK
jgi:hypothetical protein